MKMHLPVLAVAGMVAAFAATTVAAQAQNVRVRGAIESVDGQMLTVEYKIPPDKTDIKKILVTPKTIIATTVAGSKDDLKPGLKVFVAGAPKLPDGSLDVANIQVEKEIPPPQ